VSPLLTPGTAAIVRRQATPEPERELPTDPVAWARDEADTFLWSRQREIARSVVENRETLVPACHSAGKTKLAAVVAAYWIAAHPGEARVVTTAPSDEQVQGLLWHEIARTHRAANLPRILAIGNPDDPTSTFAARCDASTGSMHAPGEAYTTARGAKVLPIDAYMTPNFTGEHVPEYLREMLVARSYAEGMIGLHGEDNPLVISKVRGLFPDRSSRNVISPALIGAAWRRELPGMGRGRFGLDVSRSVHGDECALYRDRDGVLRVVEVWRDPDSAGTTARVFRATAHTPETPIVVDTDGVGGPVFDVLRRGRPELGAGVGQPRRCVPFSVNKPPRQPRDFDTRRSEVWWAARDELIAGLWDLDPADEELAAQLAAPRWTTDHRGRIHVETKEEMAKRGVSSPDRADAVIMARFGRPPIGSAQGYPPNGKAKNGNGRGSVTADLLGRPM
jgi:hypothetical protein